MFARALLFLLLCSVTLATVSLCSPDCKLLARNCVLDLGGQCVVVSVWSGRAPCDDERISDVEEVKKYCDGNCNKLRDYWDVQSERLKLALGLIGCFVVVLALLSLCVCCCYHRILYNGIRRQPRRDHVCEPPERDDAPPTYEEAMKLAS